MPSNDIKHERLRAPRTINEAFGPYSSTKLYVEPKKMPLRAYVWMVIYGVVIGFGWYVVVGLQAGAK